MKNYFLILSILFFSCSSDESEKDGYDKEGNSYDGPIETITHNGLERKYIIKITAFVKFSWIWWTGW